MIIPPKLNSYFLSFINTDNLETHCPPSSVFLFYSLFKLHNFTYLRHIFMITFLYTILSKRYLAKYDFPLNKFILSPFHLIYNSMKKNASLSVLFLLYSISIRKSISKQLRMIRKSKLEKVPISMTNEYVQLALI